MTKFGDDNDPEQQTLLHSRHVVLSMQERNQKLHDVGTSLVEIYQLPYISQIAALTH